MRIAFFVRPRRVSAHTARVVELLREGGDRVDVLCPEERAWELAGLRPEHDLYVLKSKTPMALAVGEVLAARGARLLNSAESSRLAKDKVRHSALLFDAGLPQPAAWTFATLDALRRLVAAAPAPALLVKPPGGSMAKGIHRVCRVEDLAGDLAEAVEAGCIDPDGQARPQLAQAEAPSEDGLDLKCYAVGDWVGAIRRPFPARTEEEKRGEPASLPTAIRDCVLTCGRVLGLELYGVDLLTSGDDFAVVDVNAFPSYKGVADGPRRVAEYLLR